jgi:hypothetical protein
VIEGLQKGIGVVTEPVAMPGLFAIDHVAWNVTLASRVPYMLAQQVMTGRVLRISYSDGLENDVIPSQNVE